MKIRFGLHFDGQRGWQPKTALGEITVGVSGFLEILETHLGLLRSMPVNPNASFNTVTVCANVMIRGGFSIEPLPRTNWVRAQRCWVGGMPGI